MGQPRHHHHLNTPPWCALMLVAPSRDWNVFKPIFAEHWEEFTQAHPRDQTASYDDLVTKMLGGGNPDKMGDLEYRCPHWGQGEQRVAMRCQSSLGLRCAKVYVDNWPRRAITA